MLAPIKRMSDKSGCERSEPAGAKPRPAKESSEGVRQKSPDGGRTPAASLRADEKMSCMKFES